jgi:uncharacterized protein (TIGR02145 family)
MRLAIRTTATDATLQELWQNGRREQRHVANPAGSFVWYELMTPDPDAIAPSRQRRSPALRQRKTPNRIRLVAVALSVAFGSAGGAGSMPGTATGQNVSGTPPSFSLMADGKEWTTANLNVNAPASYCYDDAEANCRRYGRLYTWESAQRVCPPLGDGWRLPTDDEWRQMAKRYGGVSADATDKGKAAFAALLGGGTSGFHAVLGGNRNAEGQYARLEAHGFYWTSSDDGSGNVPYYNFGQGGQALHRQPHGEKRMAISVRCVRDASQ